MQLHLLAFLFMVPLGAALSASPDGVADQMGDASDETAEHMDRQTDRQMMAGADAMADGDIIPDPLMACSCDCCEVTKLKPQEFVQTKDGPITSVCGKHAAAPGEEDSMCPEQCAPAEDGGILHAAKGATLDYARFCHYSCQPMSDSVGSQCMQFEKDLAKQAAGGFGNGREVYAPPVDGIGSGMKKVEKSDNEVQEVKVSGANGGGDKEKDTAEEEAPEKKEEAAPEEAAAPKAPDVNIVYDMRELVSERMRAEAGAMVSAGSMTAEQTRLNVLNTKTAVEEAKKVSALATKASAQIEGDVAGVESAKTAAVEAERKTRNFLKKSKNFAAKMMKDIKKLTEAEIEKEVAPWAQTRAEYRAEGKHLDKPEGWKKVVAARAANPYQAAVTAAVQRTAEYQRLADGLITKAQDAQRQANFLMPHVNMLEAQGDVMGATIEKKKATDLLAQAKNLQAQAQGYWETANKAHATVSKWQEAGVQAAQYAAWEYDNSETAFDDK